MDEREREEGEGRAKDLHFTYKLLLLKVVLLHRRRDAAHTRTARRLGRALQCNLVWSAEDSGLQERELSGRTVVASHSKDPQRENHKTNVSAGILSHH